MLHHNRPAENSILCTLRDLIECLEGLEDIQDMDLFLSDIYTGVAAEAEEVFERLGL